MFSRFSKVLPLRRIVAAVTSFLYLREGAYRLDDRQHLKRTTAMMDEDFAKKLHDSGMVEEVEKDPSTRARFVKNQGLLEMRMAVLQNCGMVQSMEVVHTPGPSSPTRKVLPKDMVVPDSGTVGFREQTTQAMLSAKSPDNHYAYIVLMFTLKGWNACTPEQQSAYQENRQRYRHNLLQVIVDESVLTPELSGASWRTQPKRTLPRWLFPVAPTPIVGGIQAKQVTDPEAASKGKQWRFFHGQFHVLPSTAKELLSERERMLGIPVGESQQRKTIFGIRDFSIPGCGRR